jgi:hypothetical protein
MTLINPIKRETLVVTLADGTKIKIRRYAKRNKLKDISEVVRLAISKLLGI